MKDITKKYSNGEITVVWKPAMCEHSMNCFKGLNNVFDPKKRPWVNIQGASSETIVSQVGKCPSGALRIEQENKTTEIMSETKTDFLIEVVPNGPLRVMNDVTIKHKDGTEEKKVGRVSMCRCGHSENKPFCDGSHKKINFQG